MHNIQYRLTGMHFMKELEKANAHILSYNTCSILSKYRSKDFERVQKRTFKIMFNVKTNVNLIQFTIDSSRTFNYPWFN